MAWQENPFTLPLLLSALVSFLLVPFVRSRTGRDRTPPGTRWFLMLAVGSAIWAGAYGMSLANADIAGKLFWSRVMWIGVTTTSLAWPLFVFVYTGRDHWLGRRVIVGLSVLPAATIALFWMDSPLFAYGYHLDPASGPFFVLDSVFGPVLIVYIGYMLLLGGSALAYLGIEITRSKGLYQRQAGVLFLTGSIPLIATLLYLTGRSPVAGVNPTPILFSFTTLLYAWALFRYRLLDLVPVARNRVMDEMDHGLIVVDQQHRIVDLNDTARSLFDDNGGIEVGADTTDALAAYPSLLDLVTDPGTQQCELRLDSGGSTRIFAASVSTLTDERIDGIVVVLRDVTERRHAEKRFRTLIEKSSNVIFVLDRNGHIEYVTPSVESSLGYRVADIEGLDLTDLVHAEDREEVEDAIANPGETRRVEYRIETADDAFRVFESSLDDLLDDPGIEGIVVSAHDVTEDRRYEERLQVLNRVLRHDLRNEMNLIQGHTESLLASVEGSSDRSRLEAIHEKCVELVEISNKARLIDDSLHRDAGSSKRIDITKTLERELEQLRSDYPYVEVAVDLPDVEWVYANPLIDAALENVFENAVEHTDSETVTITVSVERVTRDDGEYVTVRIADPEPVIPEPERDVLERGMETQLEHASGIGLWLVYWIVAESDGDLTIEDAEDGNVVIITLPGVPESDCPPDDPSTAPASGD